MSNFAMAHGMKKRAKKMAEGGFIHEERASGFVDHEENDVKPMAEHMEFNQEGAEDEGAGDSNGIHPVVMKIMMGRAKGYSEGGKVANQDSPAADFMPNEFDDLHLRDDLESENTGANSGDELGNSQEDSDRADIIKRIMRSRAKKDRNPSPA